jgi:hypothetical protein
MASVFVALFGGAVLAAIAVRVARHDAAPLALIATSAFAIVVIAITSKRGAASPPEEDTKELGQLLLSDNIAILGKPGSGKSTLVQFLALTFGQAKAGERRLKRRGVLRRRLGATSWLMPIPIPLRKIAAFVEGADPNVLGNLIVEAFRRKILPSGVRDKCDAAFFLRMIAARKCIFLFDGLDEVSEDSQSQALIREIVGLVSQYSGNKFLITSRYAGWRGGVGSSFKLFDVEDLSEAQAVRFIRSWYSAIEENRALQMRSRDTNVEREYRASRAMDRAGDLQQALSRSTSLNALAANPLLLSIICFVHSQKALPEERLSLYRECSNLLLGQWDREKGIPVDDTKLTLARKETIMQEVAFALHTGRIGAQYGRKEATRQEILPIVSRLLLKFDIHDADPHSLFEKLVSRSGVIVAVERYSERYVFSHLTFQEFYAAAYLFANQLDPFEATNVAAEDTSFGMTSWWSEVFALYGAMKRQSSDIVARLIDAPAEDRFGRRLRLAAQCMVDSIEVSRDVSDRLLRVLYQVRFASEPVLDLLPQLQRYLLRFASQPQFFERYGNWVCNSAIDAEDATRLLRLQCEGLRVSDTAIQTAALQGVVQIWRRWGISAPAVNEALVAALKSTMLDLQVRGISLSITLHEAGVLGESARKAAVAAFMSLAEGMCGAYELAEDGPERQVLYMFSRVSADAMTGFAGLGTSVTRLLLPGERETVRAHFWKILTDLTVRSRRFFAEDYGDLGPGLFRLQSNRLAVARCLASVCSPEEIGEIRSDLNRGLNMGTGNDQALLLPLLYVMFRSEVSTLDEVLAKLWSPLAQVSRSALLCLLDDPPLESRARIREAVRLWLGRRRARTRWLMARVMSSYENRESSLAGGEALAVRWLLEDGLPGVERPQQIFLGGPAPTNGEISTILHADGNALASMLRQKGLGVFAMPSLDDRGVRVLSACSPYLTPDERAHALKLVKRTCKLSKDDKVLSEALGSVRLFGLPLWPDDEFREALCGMIDHKHWAIADLAADLLATERAGA